MPYDYIVIGAGSAGCVVANRLSADPSTRVLLLEAGGPDKKTEIGIPAAFGKLFKTEVDWAYETQPQSELGGRRLFWPRGKMLGGSSSINAMIYQRGAPAAYDEWRDLGSEGWGWDDVFPIFKRQQHQERGASAYHGVGGELIVGDQRDPNVLSRAFVEACAEAGLGRNDDFNGATQEGFGLYQVTQKRGKRWSAANAFLKPVMKRPNLTVETHALATRLLFEDKRCVGVQLEQGGRTREEAATGEVILCGGAINSPQLLLLSGVGDSEQLNGLDIPLVHHLPGVGENLIDHPIGFTIHRCTQPVTLEKAETIGQLLKFLLFRKGLLTSNVGEAGGFTTILPDATMPDLQYHFAPAYYIEHGFQRPDGWGLSIGPTLVRPKSVGRLWLESDDPSAPPALDPAYLTHADDLKILVEGIKLCRTISQTQALAPFMGDEYMPGPDVESDEDIAQYLRETIETLYHPVGTCKMGSDERAVVDAQLRVRGLEGLRVADCSIMPTICNANTNAPAMMIGERAASFALGA